VDLAPGDAHDAVAGGGEELVAAAVVLEGGWGLVRLASIGFDD
jgi:hypothetical protein